MTYVASSMKLVLVPAEVLDPPLFKIEMNNETKMKLKWDNTFQKQPSRRVFQVCVLQISNLLKPKNMKLENMFEGKGAQINALQVHFVHFYRSCRNSYTHNRISMKHLLTATGIFWNYCGWGSKRLWGSVVESKGKGAIFQKKGKEMFKKGKIF